jgi:hypothetical protein
LNIRLPGLQPPVKLVINFICYEKQHINVNVTLIDDKSVTGASYGMISFFASGESSKRVRSVKLSHTSESVVGHFTFYDKSESKFCID